MSYNPQNPNGQGTMANSAPVVIASNQSAVPAVASQETSAIYSGTTSLTPKFAAITASASGATAVVAAVASKKIRVISYVVVANAAVNVKFQSNSTDKTGLLYLAANGGVSGAYAPTGHFETASGEALNINLSAAVAVGGHVTYVEV